MYELVSERAIKCSRLNQVCVEGLIGKGNQIIRKETFWYISMSCCFFKG